MQKAEFIAGGIGWGGAEWASGISLVHPLISEQLFTCKHSVRLRDSLHGG